MRRQFFFLKMSHDELSPTEIDIGGKRKKKFTGGNASKRHRDRVNVEFNNLAKLLPFSENVIAKLDKSSILRLAVSYIRAKSFFNDTLGDSCSLPSKVTESLQNDGGNGRSIKEGTGLVADIFSNALDGFLLVLTEDMKVLFVSESVRDYLGYCQAGIIHENFLQFVNPSDHDVIQDNILYRKIEVHEKGEEDFDTIEFDKRHSFCNERFQQRISNKSTRHNVVQRRFVCRMKCAFSCSSRFYTAYRSFEFNGHLRRSSIQEGREKKYLNTLVVFATPRVTKNDTMEVPTDLETNQATLLPRPIKVERHEKPPSPYEQRFSHGFRIEPTLRPHIAPIPIANNEAILGVRSPSQVTQPIPHLLHGCDVYGRESYNASSETMPSSAFLSRFYSAPTLSESRYSDYSDDSKCSPTSSPNLPWRKQTNLMPLPEIPNHRLDKYSFDMENRKLIESELQERLRYFISPAYRFSKKYYDGIAPSNGNVHADTDMLINVRKKSFSYPPELTRLSFKRSADTNDELYTASNKRHCSSSRSSTANRGFHISSLLGLEESKETLAVGGNPEEDVDVCNVDDERSGKKTGKQFLCKDIFSEMSKKNDLSFKKNMTVYQ